MCHGGTGTHNAAGFVVLLKTFQRLGYFVLSSLVPEPLIRHIAQSIGRNADLINLNHYDHSEARRKHVGIIRRFLDVNPPTATGKLLLRNTFIEAALIKEDVADIINVGIEVLIRHRYELPAFDSLIRTARSTRAEANQALYSRVQTAVGKEGAAFLDALFVVGDDPRRVSAWNDLKQDPARPTVYGMRHLLARFKLLTDLAGYNRALKTLPVVKISQWALEGNALDAASMADLVPARRYAIILAVSQQRLGVVTDDLCDIFCKQMNKISRAAEAELQQYLDDNQGKTDEILRRYALLNTVLHSTESADNQLKIIREIVSSRPDLYEFFRLHIEFGGKNECRFMLKAFGQRRTELLRIFYRFAAEEVALPAFRTKAISLALAGDVVAALLGPFLASRGSVLFSVPYVGSFLLMGILASLGLLLLSRLQIPAQPGEPSGQVPARPWKKVVSQPAYLVALFSGESGFGIMVLGLTATPIAMKHYCFDLSQIAVVIQLHILGRFVLSFFTGKLIDRFGVIKIKLTGVLLMLAYIALAVSGVTWGYLPLH